MMLKYGRKKTLVNIQVHLNPAPPKVSTIMVSVPPPEWPFAGVFLLHPLGEPPCAGKAESYQMDNLISAGVTAVFRFIYKID